MSELIIGITAEQVDAILEAGGIAHGKIADSAKTREAIAQVITENNKQLLKDIESLIANKKTATFG